MSSYLDLCSRGLSCVTLDKVFSLISFLFSLLSSFLLFSPFLFSLLSSYFSSLLLSCSLTFFLFPSLFLLKRIYLYKVSYRKGRRAREKEIFYHCITSNVPSGPGLGRAKVTCWEPETLFTSPAWAAGAHTLKAIFCCFSSHITLELHQKWST